MDWTLCNDGRGRADQGRESRPESSPGDAVARAASALSMLSESAYYVHNSARLTRYYYSTPETRNGNFHE